MSNDPLPTARQVIPDRKTPYVLGVLNIILGALLCGITVLMVIATIVSLFFNPMAEQFMAAATKQAQAQRAQSQARIDELHRQASEATDDARRTELEGEARDLEQKLGPEPVDLVQLMRDAQANKWITYGLPAAKYSTSLILNGLLIYTGIGLMRLRESARRGTLWLAWLKILRLLLVAILELSFAVPLQLEVQQKSMHISFNQQARGPQQVPPEAERFMMILTAAAAFGIVGGYAVVGSVYPALLVFLLTRPRVKLAFQVQEAGLAPAPA